MIIEMTDMIRWLGKNITVHDLFRNDCNLVKEYCLSNSIQYSEVTEVHLFSGTYSEYN